MAQAFAGTLGDAEESVTYATPGWQRREEGAFRERNDADPAKACAIWVRP